MTNPSRIVTAWLRAAEQRRIALRKIQLEKLMDSSRGSFGVISAYGRGAKSENKSRHGMLVADLQARGYRWVDLKGSWEGVSEKSVLVPRITPQDLFELGRKYGQDAVIYKSKEGILAMYHLKEHTAEVAVRPADLGPAFQAAANDTLYSKARGLSFSIDFLWGRKLPWTGGKPLSPADIQKALASGLLEAA